MKTKTPGGEQLRSLPAMGAYSEPTLIHVIPVHHEGSMSRTVGEGRPAMGAYSESVDAITLSQTVGKGRPVMRAYSESVDVIESQDPLQADVDFPPLGFGLHPASDCGKLLK